MIAFVVVMTLVLFALAACGSNGNDSTSNGENTRNYENSDYANEVYEAIAQPSVEDLFMGKWHNNEHSLTYIFLPDSVLVIGSSRGRGAISMQDDTISFPCGEEWEFRIVGDILYLDVGAYLFTFEKDDSFEDMEDGDFLLAGRWNGLNVVAGGMFDLTNTTYFFFNDGTFVEADDWLNWHIDSVADNRLFFDEDGVFTEIYFEFKEDLLMLTEVDGDDVWLLEKIHIPHVNVYQDDDNGA